MEESEKKYDRSYDTFMGDISSEFSKNYRQLYDREKKRYIRALEDLDILKKIEQMVALENKRIKKSD